MKYTRSIISNALGALLVWDLYRDSTRIQDFCSWALIVHFLYFQLPLKSRALAFLHPISFSGAIVIPTLYMYTLIIYPNYEVEHMNAWEMSWKATICRSLMVNLAPLVVHALDISTHQQNLIVSYQSKPEKAQTTWSFVSFFLLELVHEVAYPVTNDKFGGSAKSFSGMMKLICIITSCFSFLVLYQTIIKHARFVKVRRNKHL